MALTQTAIAILEQLAVAEGWTSVDDLDRSPAGLLALGELHDARLVEVQTWVLGTGRVPAWRRGPVEGVRRTPRREVCITWRGRDRLERIRAGRRRRGRYGQSGAMASDPVDRPEASPGWWSYDL